MRSASTLLKSCALSLAIASGVAFAAPDAPSGKIDMIDIPFRRSRCRTGSPSSSRGSQGAGRRGQHLVSHRLGRRAGAQDRFRASLRAPDVPGFGESQGRILPAVRARRRDRQNGTTWFDRTNYFETVPTTALDMALWMESDRMGHLLGAIGQTELDEQRGVVQNEKRQGENQPYGRVDERMLLEGVSGESSVSPRHDRLDEGSRRRLARRRQAMVLDELRRRERDRRAGRRHHAGDRQGEDAQKYFGDIPAGPPVPRQQPWTAPRTESTRDTHGRSRRADAHLPRMERAVARRCGRTAARARRDRARRRQDVAPIRAPRLQGQARRRRLDRRADRSRSPRCSSCRST